MEAPQDKEVEPPNYKPTSAREDPSTNPQSNNITLFGTFRVLYLSSLETERTVPSEHRFYPTSPDEPGTPLPFRISRIRPHSARLSPPPNFLCKYSLLQSRSSWNNYYLLGKKLFIPTTRLCSNVLPRSILTPIIMASWQKFSLVQRTLLVLVSLSSGG